MLPNSRRLILQLFGHFSGDFEYAVEKKLALIEALLCKFTRPIHTKTSCLNRAFVALLGELCFFGHSFSPACDESAQSC